MCDLVGGSLKVIVLGSFRAWVKAFVFCIFIVVWYWLGGFRRRWLVLRVCLGSLDYKGKFGKGMFMVI